eukprot:6128568-Amphidinium_carterae.1
MLEEKLRKADQRQLSATCEAAASVSALAHQAEASDRQARAKIATVESTAAQRERELHSMMLHEETTAAARLYASARDAEVSLKLREEQFVKSNAQSRTDEAERSASELRGGLAGRCSNLEVLEREQQTNPCMPEDVSLL